MVWLGRHLKDHRIPAPLLMGHLPLVQVAASPIQAGLQRFQRQSIHSFSRKYVPVPPQPPNIHCTEGEESEEAKGCVTVLGRQGLQQEGRILLLSSASLQQHGSSPHRLAPLCHCQGLTSKEAAGKYKCILF